MFKFMFFLGEPKDTASDPGFAKLQEKGLYKIKKNVTIMLRLNAVLPRKGTVLNSFIGRDMQDCLLLAKRKLGGAKFHYTGIYNTHAIDPMYGHKVYDLYRKAVKYNTPGVSYINKLSLRCDPSGPNVVIHWCSDHATKVALYTLKKCLN